jgi:hypothetical protein
MQSVISKNTKQQQNQRHSAVDFSSVHGDEEFPRSETGDMISKMRQIRNVVSKVISFDEI